MPRYSNDLLNSIYDNTYGYCACCRKKLAFVNYGILGARANWEVDHDVPVSRGGQKSSRIWWRPVSSAIDPKAI